MPVLHPVLPQLRKHPWRLQEVDPAIAYLDGGLDDYRPDSDPPDTSGWWNSRGSGNRNRTVGDSIFHCHLYPHFAQGMWSLWRVHDVLEDGSRRLPDGQPAPGLSVGLLERDPDGGLPPARIGSVAADGSFVQDAAGTPIPGLIPLPDLPAPLLPTYAGDVVDGEVVSAEEAVSGYPFFVAGEPGHRAPQAPLDIARTDDGSDWLDGGLPRHVVLGGSNRALGIGIPDGTLDADTASASGSEMSPLEDALYRLTAKMLALGDFTGHLTEASIKVLPNDGDVMERGAMTFHHDGAGLALLDAQGAPSTYAADRGGYRSALASDGAATGYFAVNGAPPKPGAPFADPCGAPSGYTMIDPEDPDSEHPTQPLALIADPFRPANGADYADFVPDPALTGFRRYEVSAVQVDIVTNKAGWHDPQGRINVLTERSDAYKDRGPSAREEPFFFRAYSGDCVEFRHTNELPKELELDDFQVQTPTDTIGQHIHLVKFDVTSADGSGNGFNYEDGTFAADEIALRLCAMLDGAADTPSLAAGSQVAGSKVAAMSEADWSGLCKKDTDHWVPKDKAHWAAKRGENPERFQTTVQRWFADPILSIEASGSDEEADRTMRTVFSHDHFGPSSIQQHGFYSALVIEPRGTTICPGYGAGNPDDDSTCMTPQGLDLEEGDETGTGVHKIVKDGDELHPNYREFALAVADFALLYDPSDGQPGDIAAAGGPIGDGLTLGALPVWQEGGENPVFGPKGLAKLVCEAQFRTALGNEASPGPLQTFCDAGFEWGTASDPLEAEGISPALVAAALIEDGEVQDLRRHLGLVRLRAGFGEGFARPVNAPERPESISVSHHDPYLVNYRGEPVPLRIGDTSGKSEDGAEQDGGAEEDGEVDDAGAAPLPGATDAHIWPAAVTLEPEEDSEAKPAEAANTAFDCFADRDVASDLLSQFKRRNPAAPGSALPDLPAPGAFENPGDALGQQIADATSIKDCSIDGQSGGARGDLANVYRSVLTDADGGTDDDDLAQRPHGDPATPLLETYSDERVQIRLIQGAQEVQHTFNMEGMLWRRHIDQKYPSGAAPLDSVLPGQTWWQACREAGRTGIARQHDRWRNGLLAPTDDTAYWDAHSELVAACDNLEGFTAAQEVGISEHFEIPSAPSKYAVSNRFGTVSGEGENEAGHDDPALDYLYHFGSQDAVWNGAWGLMRVFEKLDAAKDVTQELEQSDGACAADAMDGEGLCNISDVLRPVPETVPEDADAARGQVPLPEAQAAACPAQAPRIEAYAVAMPLEGGMSYASWDRKQFDPDGLALVHVPKSLALPWLNGVSDDALAAVRAAARPYFRDEPMVIRGNAGDCLSLTVINALGRLDGPAPQGCASSDAGPRDCLGDAPMPRIVSLNVEPDWTGGDEHAAPGPSRLMQKNDINVRPSDQLALTAPMSMLTRAKDAHLPFGINTTVAVKAGEVHHAEYYLGFLRVDWPLIDGLMGVTDVEIGDNLEQHSLGFLQCSQRGLGAVDGAFTNGAQARVDALLAGEDPAFTVITRNTPMSSEFGSFTINVLGRTYHARLSDVLDAPANARISPEALQLLALRSRACFRDLLAVKGLGNDVPGDVLSIFPEATPLHAQPYAFGAVPLKPVSDMFNQLPHGLFGALVVEPIGAEYAGRQMTAGDQGGYEPASPLIQGGMAHRGRAANTVVTIPDPFAKDAAATRSFREFVLFYQDGLNLWDDETTNEWLTLTGEVAPIVDDCPICDDSYDLGEKAASYRSAAFHLRTRQGGNPGVEAHSNLNSRPFATDFFKFKDSLWSNAMRLWALPDEEVVIRVLHPGGRARQRAFVISGHDYDDLFPGFGFPHSALLAPGKAISAALSAPVQPGCSMWADGPRQVFAAGVWGLMDVLGRDGSTSCGFSD
ncbi:hypothetical protein DC366_12655 [Pelagivirga sediminicola]|uniref:Plastocyanin-like domain-containing protein n=2 Tax=Pelagivirga sediminicola TaxID=2170575 RepID=A0A2T7G581_9RHOB|nr:hypothetical protein DC366_12655 [Pelagivirga sediminicola]